MNILKQLVFETDNIPPALLPCGVQNVTMTDIEQNHFDRIIGLLRFKTACKVTLQDGSVLQGSFFKARADHVFYFNHYELVGADQQYSKIRKIHLSDIKCIFTLGKQEVD